MNFHLASISPFKLAIFCGALSTFLNFAGVVYSQGIIFFLILFILNSFWLSPIAFITLLHGRQYGLLASGIVTAAAFALTGFYGALATFTLNCFPIIYCAYLLCEKDQTADTEFMGVGKVFSKVCFFYLGILVLSLGLIFDQNSIQTTAENLLKGIGHQDVVHLSHTSITLFPALMCCSVLILIMTNLLLSLKILNQVKPEIRPFPLDYDKKIPEYWDIVFIAGLLLILTRHEMSAFIGKNVLLLSCLPLYVYGLSIISGWLKQLDNWKLWIGFIALFSILLAWPAMLVIFLGLLRPILKMNKSRKSR